jgi:membrane carboxypeptidase/penicillin-binding protein
LKLVIVLVALAIVAVAVQSCVAFFRTPSVVAQAWKSGILQLQLSEFREQRLQWLLKVQDPDFYHHHGVDPGTPGAGYTTITQGLVKVLFYSCSFKPGFLRWRKMQQTVIALAFNARVPKDNQLRLFVNLAYMGDRNGRRITGFSQAAQEYFGKDFQNLTDEEYLALVAVLVAPARYSPATRLADNQERVRRIRRVLAGTCKPVGHADVEYVACAQ